MEKIYLKVFELTGLKEDDTGKYYIKVYWKNKKYKTAVQEDGCYFFNEVFLIPVEHVVDEKNEILSIEVWLSSLFNTKVAYTFFTLDFMKKEKTVKQKVQLIDILKSCTLELSVNIVRDQMDVTFFNVKEIYLHKTDKEIKDAISMHRTESEVLRLFRNEYARKISSPPLTMPAHGNQWTGQGAPSTNQWEGQIVHSTNRYLQRDNLPKENMHSPNEKESYAYAANPYVPMTPATGLTNSHYHYNPAVQQNELTSAGGKIPVSVPSQLNSGAVLANHSAHHAGMNINTDRGNPSEKYGLYNPHMVDSFYGGGNHTNQVTYHNGMYNVGAASPYSDKILYRSSRNKKKALLIGINYYGSKEELSGCTNDTVRMMNLLISKYNFHDSPTSMVRLIDNESNPNYRPTRKNILSALTWLTKDNEPGDVFFFLYSGHGSQQKDYTYLEDDGYNETILPCDHKTEGQIIDDELHRFLVQPLNDGVKLIAIMDCCNAGSCIDLAYKYKLKSRKWKEVKNPFHVVCDVSQFSGCKDMEFSHEIDTGRHAPGGALITAMIHVLGASEATQRPTRGTDSLTYDHLLQNVSSYIQSYHDQKIVFMASQKFDLNRVFDFDHILKNKNGNLGQNVNKLVHKNKKTKKNKHEFFSFF
ncbi:metacaspase 1, putative [Plasmodium knowlesi strain H]|uniref:Metacaspase 1, putative n=3 Tax=Plasmodium knowlesi TaxID=5850 RepID=A0A5K1U8W2_PLAKH|nr:metacaspase-1, putative [Plasmodium knowlesi strain H]OTN64501.1 putative Metacaspase 1 [Plasmodium knowlesi]CAA9988998.1 metacaspase-1, putative [Plasmodium knowlesi strain H]SBO24842.1 metacaspase 1, putative [Plasmodium knowlesi strain H]SBO27578.1 metacaspase 1, putative [Plasmodium knowlesi strain H]VVS78472.1 metacaspase-1, putative [Plasmodium knowlesi strain H]|eukprot:XP_002261346.1 metacaspase-like protein [Plasmodium knowlesi strain H]